MDKKAKSCIIINVVVPGDCRIREKEIEKIEQYQNLERERGEKTLVTEKDWGCTSGCGSSGLD